MTWCLTPVLSREDCRLLDPSVPCVSLERQTSSLGNSRDHRAPLSLFSAARSHALALYLLPSSI